MSNRTAKHLASLQPGTLFAGVDLGLDDFVVVVLTAEGLVVVLVAVDDSDAAEEPESLQDPAASANGATSVAMIHPEVDRRSNGLGMTEDSRNRAPDLVLLHVERQIRRSPCNRTGAQ